MVVDDTPVNVHLLEWCLSTEGYAVCPVTNGTAAVKKAREVSPDLILLDVTMPDMNGFDVCRQLKEFDETAEIPIIFISALDGTEDKLEGFDAGGVDYIIKPFQMSEVVARVRTHLELRSLRTELEQRNDELNAFGRTVAHDLKSPLTAISMASRLIQGSKTIEDTQEMLRVIDRSVQQVSSITDALFLLATIGRDEVPLAPVELGAIVHSVKLSLKNLIEEQGCAFEQPDTWPAVITYAPWVQQVLSNYISNAIKYGGRPPLVTIAWEEMEASIRISVTDNGPGLSREQQAQLFKEFSRMHTERASGHGLGLSIVARIATKLSGMAGVESEPGEGSTFFLDLPLSSVETPVGPRRPAMKTIRL